MALNALTLSVTSGVQGRSFKSAVSGMTAGNIVEVLPGGAPGFGYVNGFLTNHGLPQDTNLAILRERNPVTGENLTTNLIITAASAYAVAQKASTLDPTYRTYRIAPVVQGDGSQIWYIFTDGQTGATLNTPVNGPAVISISGTPPIATVGVPYSFTPTTLDGSGTKSFAYTGTALGPLGLSFSTTTGAITGTPTSAATITGTITVTDSSGSAPLPINVTINVAAPANTVLPAITGTAQDGQTLSVSNGTWTNSPTGYTYQWRADGTPISGAINNTRILTAAEVGKIITCSVTATNVSGSTTATSAGTSAVIAAGGALPANTVAPVISGTATVGSTLTTTNGTWTNSPTGYTYQWRRDGVNISGATASTYVVVSGDGNTTLTCRVTATNASGSASVTSNGIAIIAGAAATSFAIAPTVQYHANTATMTMAPDANLTGYISGNTMTITANDGGPLMVGDVIKTGAAAGTKILRCGTSFGALTGTFTVDISQTVGSVGSQVAFTVDTKTVLSITDGRATADLASLDGLGPRLMVDALGRKFWRFQAPVLNKGSWLRSLTLGALDTYQCTWIMAGRFHDANNSGSILSHGLKENSTGAASVSLAYKDNFPTFLGKNPGSQTTPPANVNKLLLGTQLQVLGIATATDVAVGTSTGTVAGQIMLNEQAAVLNPSSAQSTGKTGFEFGKGSTVSTTNAAFDVYELAGWTTGQMGNRAAMPANALAQQMAMVNNFAIPAITDSVMLVGDSRSVNGAGSGNNLACKLGEPGYAFALPASTRILNTAVSGAGIGTMWQNLDRVHDTHNAAATSPLNASLMLGGGHDMVGIYVGINDTASLWPTTTIGGRGGLSQTSTLADDYYNGADYTNTFTATIANNTAVMTVTGLTGYIYNGSKLAIAGTSSGLCSATSSNTGPFTLNAFEVPGVSGVAGTCTLSSMQKYVQALLTRGFKVRWASETLYGGGDTAARAQLRSRIMNDAVNDVTTAIGSTLAANLSVLDLADIAVGGQKVFGANYTGSVSTDPNWMDSTHPSPTGQANLVSGGDDPTKGYSYALTH